MFKFAIVSVPVYTVIANCEIPVFNAFGVEVGFVQLTISFLLGGCHDLLL